MPVPAPAALHHTCFVVRDIEKAVRALKETLGVGPWNFWTIEPAESRVHGEPRAFSFRVALCTVGGGTFEVITPASGSSAYDEHLELHGDGFHHICLVYPTMEAVRAAKAELVHQGRELLQEGSAGSVFDFSYFLFPEIGAPVELLYLDAAQLPPPEMTI